MNTLNDGYTLVYGDNIDTDVIIPARYLNTSNEQELASHCLEDLDPEFVNKVKCGDILVVGENFGCGSSREHAPIAIKACGVSVVIAKSFARIFFRNAINIGLPILEHPTLSDEVKTGDRLQINLSEGVVKNLTQNIEYTCAKFPKEIQELVQKGGLINYTKDKLLSDGFAQRKEEL